MSEEYGEIRISQDLLKKIKIRVEEAGFTSVDEYVTFVMEEVIKEVENEEPEEVFSEEDEEKVKERLRALGYLD